METFATASPYAYFGTYTVEWDANDPTRKGTIHHNVFSDVLRTYTGTVQARPFVGDGPDYLHVGVQRPYLRRLKRLI
jgi:hypothetical protein